MIELSRTQDEEVGDGTTSVIILGMSLCSMMSFMCYVGYSLHALIYISMNFKKLNKFLIRLASWLESDLSTI